MTYAKGFYEAQKGAEMTFQDRADQILFDSIVAVGLREEGAVRDLDTLIIDRRKALAQLTAVHQESVVEELEGLEDDRYLGWLMTMFPMTWLH